MILVNQKGYSIKSGLRAVFQSTVGKPLIRAELTDAFTGKVLSELTVAPVEEVRGWKNRKFQKLSCSLKGVGPGRCRIIGETADGIVYSENFSIRREMVAEKELFDLIVYFKAMRCDGSFDKADSHAPVWGSIERKDVHGGWYDASGDTSKYLSHLSYAGRMSPQQTPLVVWVMGDILSRYDRSSLWNGQNFRRWVHAEMIHGADFLLRMQDESGWFYKTLFDQWSKDPEARMLCSYKTQKGERLATMAAGFREGGGMACAALAAASALADDENKSAYLSAAEKGYAYLKQNNRNMVEGGPENLIDDYCALMASLELYNATGNSLYREDVRVHTGRILSSFHSFDDKTGWWYVIPSERIPYYHASDEGLILLALQKVLNLPGEDDQTGQVRSMLVKAYGFLERTLQADPDPFYYPRHWVKGHDEPGLQWFYPHTNPSGYWWQGENSRISSLGAAALSASASGLCTSGYAGKTALSMMDWQLGINPFGVSMVDGWGAGSPEYEGDYYNLPGGVANGITSGFDDEEDIAFQPVLDGNPGDNSWRWGEQWIPHAAWFLLMASYIRQEQL